jgi:hypothetical protein
VNYVSFALFSPGVRVLGCILGKDQDPGQNSDPVLLSDGRCQRACECSRVEPNTSEDLFMSLGGGVGG